jgi:predicted DNA binding CopG/RHH family protein
MADELQKKTAAPTVNVHVRVPAAQYDAMYRRASAARLPLGEWIRRALHAHAHDPRRPRP